ncbi:LamG-like jellyroll fold domain-containing protein [Paenibacillus sp. NPDC056722]|uniref:LamG-like jellyroll fold domain-containing protein n=1 Tax=Paenibacillus sp. NPDC056722 TaxID=3345924 RepID=UPI0036C51EAC
MTRHGRSLGTQRRENPVEPLAHWRFTPDGVEHGSLQKENLVLRDYSGKGNRLLLTSVNLVPGHSVTASDLLTWETEEGEEGLAFRNDRLPKGSGYYFWTEQEAPLNKESMLQGFTIEAIIRLPDPFDEVRHSWMGVLTRQGQGGELGRSGERELLSSLSVSNCKEIQWVSHPENLHTSTTNWTRQLEAGDWHHVVIVNDTHRTLLFVNGICDYNSPLEGISGIAAVKERGWNVGASEWAGGIDTLFTGTIREIRVTGEALHPDDWLCKMEAEQVLEGSFEGEPELQREENYHFVFIPDPQMQTYLNPEMLEAQTAWIVKHEDHLQLAMTAFVGDLVHRSEVEVEWERASAAVAMLDQGKVPYMMTAGNHDYDEHHTYLHYFGPERFQDKSYYCGASPSRYSSYGLKPAGSYTYLWLMVDMEHLEKDMDWCRDILESHRNYPTILVSHDIMYTTRHRAMNLPELSENGVLIWKELVYPYDQVFMTVNGHFNGNVHQVRKNASGQEVIQILVNYQDRYRGGNGWLRLAEFDEVDNRMRFRSFSPWVASLGVYETLEYPDYRFLTGRYDEFELALPFKTRFAFAAQQ